MDKSRYYFGDLFQFKFEGVDQWAQADVFLDNIYFWKENPIGLPINFDKGEEFEAKDLLLKLQLTLKIQIIKLVKLLLVANGGTLLK